MKFFPALAIATLLGSGSAFSVPITIGYYDSSREVAGFSGKVFPQPNPYLSQAAQSLVDQGYTLVATNTIDAAFLAEVDAFYTGLVGSVSTNEVSALQDFVNNQGGFLFLQTDWSNSSSWTPAATSILDAWGITHDGSYTNDAGNHTVGSSPWVSNPNVVNGFTGGNHSAITSAPGDFQVIAADDLNRPILGVLESGANRSGNLLVATDINMWDDFLGWKDSRNQALWSNIWSTASDRSGGAVSVPDTISTLTVAFCALAPLVGLARHKSRD